MGRGATDTSSSLSAETRQVTPERFKDGWVDLNSRLNSAYTELRQMMRGAPSGSDERQRLAAKLQGLDNAIDLYELSRPRDGASEADFQDLWLNYTGAVQRAIQSVNTGSAENDQAYRAGLKLSLDYQRGYGFDASLS